MTSQKIRILASNRQKLCCGTMGNKEQQGPYRHHIRKTRDLHYNLQLLISIASTSDVIELILISCVTYRS
jgi:hypothetical protein